MRHAQEMRKDVLGIFSTEVHAQARRAHQTGRAWLQQGGSSSIQSSSMLRTSRGSQRSLPPRTQQVQQGQLWWRRFQRWQRRVLRLAGPVQRAKRRGRRGATLQCCSRCDS
jgi:hypothetical protein